MIGLVLASLLLVVAIYEWVAVRTKRLPTITATVKAGGWPVRILVAAVGVWTIVDHFVWDGGLI